MAREELKPPLDVLGALWEPGDAGGDRVGQRGAAPAVPAPCRAQLCFGCCFLPDFSNVISKSDVKSLAEADEQEVVAEVQVNLNILYIFYVLYLNILNRSPSPKAPAQRRTR